MVRLPGIPVATVILIEIKGKMEVLEHETTERIVGLGPLMERLRLLESSASRIGMAPNEALIKSKRHS